MAGISHVEKSRVVPGTKVKICTLYSTLSLINQLQIVATVQNQKNLVGLALYSSIRRILGIVYKRKYYVLHEMLMESTTCNTCNNYLAALESNRIDTI